MNSVVALTRLTMPKLDLQGVGELGNRLRGNLGYESLHHARNEQVLLSILSAYGAMPFDMVEVEAYKKQKQKEVYGFFGGPRWYANHIRHYPLPIPIDILEKIDKISREANRANLNVHFGVDYLGTVNYEYEAARREERYDPFVYVELINTENRYYFEVWDEPGFVRKEK